MIDRSEIQGANPDLLTTGQVARRFKVTLQTLHFYEAEGLVVPLRVQGRRAYDAHHVARLDFVVKHRRLGCTLKQIAELLAATPLLVALGRTVS